MTLVVALALAGCGYEDNNADAAREVAQAYLDAHAALDPGGICRVLAPEVQVAIGAGIPCADRLRSQLEDEYPKLTVGAVTDAPSPPLNPRYAVEVMEQSGRRIVVGRYGSIWRVIDGGRPPEAAP